MRKIIAFGITSIIVLAPFLRMLEEPDFRLGVSVPLSRLGWFFFRLPLVNVNVKPEEMPPLMTLGGAVGGFLSIVIGVTLVLLFRKVLCFVWAWAAEK